MDSEGFQKIKVAKIEKEETNPSMTDINNNNNNTSTVISKEDFVLFSENEVGITEFVTLKKEWKCKLKERFSDFHVHEITPDRQRVTLTDLHGVPPEEEEMIQAQKQEPSLPENLFKERSQELIEIIGQKQFDAIQDLTTNPDAEKVQTEKIEEKQNRGKFHQLLRVLWPKKLYSVAENGVIVVYNTKNAPSNVVSRERKTSHRQLRAKFPDYLAFTIYKENRDTFATFRLLANMSRGSSANLSRLFGFAGTKDKRGITTQRATVKNVSAVRMQGVNKVNGLRVGNFQYVEKPLLLGHLWGNHFSLVLRDIHADDLLVQQSCTDLKNSGFINYFGLQRFGKEGITPRIGCKVLKSNFREAIEILMQKTPHDTPELSQAKTLFEEKKILDAVKLLSANNKLKKSIEYSVLESMNRLGMSNSVDVFGTLPRTLRMMYVHGYQSYVWNHMVSERIRWRGMTPVVGDLVFVHGEESVDLDFDADPAELDEDEDFNLKEQKVQVKALTEEDIQSQKYKFEDLILPVPGTDSVLPKNEMAEKYKAFLAKDDFSLESFRSKWKEYHQKGAYRKILAKVENFSSYITTYDDPNISLLETDLEKLEKKNNNNNSESQSESKSRQGGKYKALVLEFDLKSSCYATMAIRELTHCATLQTNFDDPNNEE